MQWEYVPQEDRLLYLIKHSPNDRRRAFGHGFADSLAFCAYAPTLRMLLDMNIVGERKSGPPATAVTQITSDPDGINRPLRRFVDHRRPCMRERKSGVQGKRG